VSVVTPFEETKACEQRAHPGAVERAARAGRAQGAARTRARELLEELRSLIPGAEVLFGFLLAIRFTNQFGALDSVQRLVYYVTLVSTALALVLLLAPAAYHRVRFREGDKDFMLRKGNREAIAGTIAIGVALTGVLFVVTDLVYGRPEAVVVSVAVAALLVWRWWAVAFYRTLREQQESPQADNSEGQ
jgi:amino acid transporter